MLDEFGAQIENAESKLDATMRKMVTVTAGIPTDWQTRLGSCYIIIELKLSRINQVYYQILFYKRRKRYHHLQSVFNQKSFAKDNKNAKEQGLGLGNLIILQ